MPGQTLFADLQKDHEEIRNLMASVLVERDPDEIRALAIRLEAHLHVHMHIEEHVVFPLLLKRVQDKEARIMIRGSISEHALIKHLRDILRATPAEEEAYHGQAYALDRLLMQHFGQEEGRLYQVARDNLSFQDFSFLKDRIMEARQGFEAELKTARRT